MNKLSKRLISALALGLFSLSIHAQEIIQYKGKPVTIELSVGQERSINFGAHVQVGTTQLQKQRNLFRTQTAQGYVHIRANKEFEKERIQIKRMDNGTLMLIDVIARTAGDFSEEVRVMTPEQNQITKIGQSTDNHKIGGERPISPVDLTRFAAKRLYAPTRLVQPVTGIHPVSLGIKGEVKIFKGLNRMRVIAKPIFALQGGGYYLTALHLVNMSPDHIQLDYLDLNLPFTHATYQHHTLHPAYTAGSDTALYLISDKPLTQMLVPWDYYAPAAEAVTQEKE